MIQELLPLWEFMWILRALLQQRVAVTTPNPQAFGACMGPEGSRDTKAALAHRGFILNRHSLPVRVS